MKALIWFYIQAHRKKNFSIFPSPAGMSLFPPRESLVSDTRAAGTGISKSFFYGVSYIYNMHGTRFQFTSNGILKQKGVLCIGNKQLQKSARDTQAVHRNHDPHSL